MSILTSSPLKVVPSAAAGTTVTGGAAVWTYGAWVQFIASAPAPLAIASIVISSGSFASRHVDFDIGIGGAGAEVSLGVARAMLQNSGIGGPSILTLRVPMGGITAGSRVAVRIRDSGGGSLALGLALQYYENPDFDQVSSATENLLPLPDAGVTALVASTTAWANSAWGVVSASIPGTPGNYYLLAGLAFTSPGIADAEFDIGTGGAGAESVITTLRASNNESSGSGRVVVAHTPGLYPIPIGTRVSVRVRRSDTSAKTFNVAIYGYGNIPPLVPPETRTHRVTQVIREVAYSEDEEPIEPAPPCTAGGTVASGTNPTSGADLSTATVPLAWVEVTIGATTHRWAAAGIPHGLPKTGRVLRFGVLTRRLTDGDGGPQASTVTTVLSDTDRTLRTAAFTGTLKGALAEYFVADLDTLRASGAPQRVFCGRVQRWTADAGLTLTLTVQDDLTARLTSANAQDVRSPIRVLDRRVHDNSPTSPLFDKAAPEIYGSVSDEAEGEAATGSVEARMINSNTFDAALGNTPVFLVSAQVCDAIQSVYAGDATQDPPTDRVRVPDAAFGDWIFAPGKPGWPLPDDWWETSGQRWTILIGRQEHPVIKLAAEGRIPIAVNVCGYETVGDTTGAVITSPPRAFLHWMNNRLLVDATGNWEPIFSLGAYSLFDTTTFEAVHALCAARGYVVAGVIGWDHSFVSWRERVAEWCRNFGWDVGTNRYGQVMLTLLDTGNAFASARTFTPETILENSCSVDLHSDAVENVVSYVYRRNYVTTLQRLNPVEGERAWRDPHDAEWLSGIQSIEDSASIAALGGEPQGLRRAQRQEYTLVRDSTTADDVAARRLALHAPANGRAEVSFGLLLRDGWSIELGDVVRVEHWDLPWTAPRRCQVRQLAFDLDRMTVTVTARDVDDLLA